MGPANAAQPSRDLPLTKTIGVSPGVLFAQVPVPTGGPTSPYLRGNGCEARISGPVLAQPNKSATDTAPASVLEKVLTSLPPLRYRTSIGLEQTKQTIGVVVHDLC